METLQQTINHQDGQIVQLVETERILREELAKKEERIGLLIGSEYTLREELRCKCGHIEQLLESERTLTRQLEEERNMSIKRRVLNRVLPIGSRRRFIVKMAVKTVRHPSTVLKLFSVERCKRLLEAIKSGDLSRMENRIMPYVGGSLTADLSLALIEDIKNGEYEPFSLPKAEKPLVSIVIPAYNQFDYNYKCIKSILNNSGDVAYEVLLADDCSTDKTRSIGKLIENLRVVHTKKNLCFLLNCNNAGKHAQGEYILFLNNDTQVQPNWLRPLVQLMEKDDTIGMVGSKLVYPDGRLQEAGGIIWKDGSAWNFGHSQDRNASEYNYVKDVDYISGASIMIRTSLWQQLGGFDEGFVPAYCEDSDLAFSVRKAGYRVVYQPLSVVVHYEGVSNGTDTSSGLKAHQVANSQKLQEKWKEEFAKHKNNGEDVFHSRDRSWGKKTVLFVDHYVPTFDKDAGSRTVFAYIKLFVHAGYNVKFIGDNFYQEEPYTTVLQQMGVEVLYGPWYALHWKEWIAENAASIDYAFLNRPNIAYKYIDWLREKTDAKIIYYGHDLHFLRICREYELTRDKSLLSQAEKWKNRELELMCKSDMAYYPSEVEVQAIRQIAPSICVKAIPAYLFDDVTKKEYNMEERDGLFFIGGFTHGPNVDAVKWLAREIMPKLVLRRPDIRVYIAGSNMPEEFQALASEHLIFVGRLTDEELELYYQKSRLCIVPLRYGAGIKGKVVESIYKGLPVVTTSCGAEGIIDAQDVLTCADTPDEIVDSIVALYDDQEKLRQLCQKGLKYVHENYSEKKAKEVIGSEFLFS